MPIQRLRARTGRNNLRSATTIDPVNLRNELNSAINACTQAQLRKIFEDAPKEHTQSIEYNPEKPLDGVLDLEGFLAKHFHNKLPSSNVSIYTKDALNELNDTPIADLVALADSDLLHFQELISQGKSAYNRLIPIEGEHTNKQSIVATACAWRAQMYEGFYESAQANNDTLRERCRDHERAHCLSQYNYVAWTT